jgi:hypothetical protein
MANAKSNGRKRLTVKQTLKKYGKNAEGIIDQIIVLYKRGFEKAEIVKAGYNKNTVYRQCREKVDLAA